MEKDKHHILFPRTLWDNGYAKVLRQHWYLVVTVPKSTVHAAIHREIYKIPPVTGPQAKDILSNLKLLEKQGAIKKGDPIEKRLTVLIALTDCLAPETTEALREQLHILQSCPSQNLPQ